MKRTRTLSRLLAALGIIFFASSAFAGGAASDISKENGPLENAQVGILCVGGIIFLLHAGRSERAFRGVFLMGFLLCLSFILREVDLDRLAVPQWVALVGSGVGRNILVTSGWLAIGVLSFKSRDTIIRQFKPLILSYVGLLVVISGGFLLLGALIEEMEIDPLYEEMAETIGYIFLLVGAVALRPQGGQVPKLPVDGSPKVVALDSDT
jgi:hypothetical protein